MRILIAADLYWPTINGVATFARNLARGLANEGHEVIVIAPSQTGPASVEVDGNYRIYRVTAVPLPLYMNFRIALNPRRAVARIIDEFQPDIIHIQNLMAVGQATIAYGKKAEIPIVATNHAMSENLIEKMRVLVPISRPINYILKEYGKRFHLKADYVTMPTQSALDMFVESARPNIPLEAVSNGIDLSQFRPLKAPVEIYKKYNLPTDTPIVTYVGRLDGEKHIGVLLRAFAEIADHSAHLLLVGEGAEEDRLKQQAEDLEISERTTFTGRVSDEDLALLHRVGTVFCMPSPAELQSLATLEAMASGKPVVAVEAGALPELCHDKENGFLCETDDADDMTDKLNVILGDKTMQQRFSKESLAIAAKHDLKYTIARFLAIYSDLIDAKKAE